MRSSSLTQPLAIFLLTVVAAGLNPRLAQATILTVNTTTDELNADGDCSLREAVRAANLDTTVSGCPAGSGADEIILPAGTYVLTRTGQDENFAVTGDLDLSSDLTITGAGAAQTIIDGNKSDRVFHILFNDPTVTISGVTIQNGDAPHVVGGFIEGSGGGIQINFATLTLINTVVRNNTAEELGAGIDNSGALTLINSEISGNTVSGGISLLQRGGGIASVGERGLTIIDSTISNNFAALTGGGLGLDQGKTTITNSTINNNAAGEDGGGIFSFVGRPSGHLNKDPLTIVNSTISGNRAGDFGGGILNVGKLILDSVTITNNVADENRDGMGDGGGIFNSHSVKLKGSIIADNADNSPGAEAPDCYPRLTSKGYNLVGNTKGCKIGKGKNLLGTAISPLDPLLGPLQDNGGSTFTHALLPGSPAIDKGDPLCKDQKKQLLRTDQRGITRPQGTACDIGAYEAEP
jgi:CSLREA domain-containing protein